VPESGTKANAHGRADGAQAPGAEANGDGGKPAVCTVAFCPICMAVTAAQGAAPDAVEHLLKAAREFFLAARAVIDVRGDHLEGSGPPAPDRLEKIEIE
jgi:hypothetical protein